MPTISMFYGLIVEMFFKDIGRHNQPHIHVRYQNDKVVIAIPSGDLLAGDLPLKKMKLMQAWITLHEEELMQDWALAVEGKPVFSIQPLN
jgi:Domain of unknown function (DUF4160)